MLNNKVSKAVRLAIAFGAASTAAFSAQSVANDEGAEKVERIEVTGSRIKRADLESASPVTVLDVSDIKAEGITNVAVALQSLTAQTGGLTSSVNNGGGGKASVNLRALGSNRTLVLINGRRIPGGGLGADSSVDLNEIPMAIVKRIEVLKDGASAVYGSDAVAGVVNIITRTDFEGFEVTGQVGQSFESDAENGQIDFTFGTSGEKGNIVVTMGYFNRGEARQGDRDYSDCPIDERAVFDPNDETKQIGAEKFCAGSANVIGGAVAGSPGFLVFEPGGDGTTNPKGYHSFSDADRYNYSTLSFLDTPAERYSLGTNGTYELSDTTSVYFEGNYTKRLSDQQMAPQPINGSVGEPGRTFLLPINKDIYPYMGLYDFAKETGDEGADERMFALRRMTGVGARQFNQAVDSVRFVLGANGEFSNGYTWDAYHLYGRSDASQRTENYINMDRVYRSINDNCVGVTVNGAPGNYTVEGNDVTAPCINYMGADSLSKEDADYIRYTDQRVGYNQMSLTALSISGELFELPGGYAGFAAGYEHREEEGGTSPDALTVSGVGSGNASNPTKGSFKVDEIYAELYLPVIEDLEITAALRAFDYSTFGQDETWKLGFKYAPIDGLTLRGTVSTAFRAPSISDLFGGQSTSYPPYNDPCENWDNGDANSNTYKNCSRDVAAGFEQPNGQVDRALLGGNPELQPETADTITYGFIYEPEFIDGFSMTLDYFKIEMEDVITNVPVQTIIDKCYQADDGGIGGSSMWCKSMSRNPIGTVSGIVATDDNLSVWEVEGIDFNFNYTTELSNMTLKVDWEGTHNMSWLSQDFEGEPIDENVGRATTRTIPEWKHTLSTSLRADDWSVTWVARYISESETASIFDAKQDLAQGIASGVSEEALEVLKNGVTEAELDSADSSAEAYITHNLSVSYYVSDNFSVSAGIRNLTDETPPYFTDYGDSNTDQYTYDTVGRRWFMSFSSKF